MIISSGSSKLPDQHQSIPSASDYIEMLHLNKVSVNTRISGTKYKKNHLKNGSIFLSTIQWDFTGH